jgi:hypothetical protein
LRRLSHDRTARQPDLFRRGEFAASQPSGAYRVEVVSNEFPAVLEMLLYSLRALARGAAGLPRNRVRVDYPDVAQSWSYVAPSFPLEWFWFAFQWSLPGSTEPHVQM